ncbi:ATP phosphoribosyltransferase [Actinoplanes teichomyceticus]|uniref:ATP phosphoribosyltransferase n=1 Tax=Actinoplanes teichomyceticus TaxID=1867 RepID=A0A561VIN1_ACTTI|nr:ATP phosphoribosyltransferase [Actinoplanes teichomyceticus]TWG11478.1 ATP phosphoribosyltransferase [Actinoplanes teichomyceticus]GIF15708.1 hypothetical protein Ate01nite_57400 [Actinoplanes teichomyceticus]
MPEFTSEAPPYRIALPHKGVLAPKARELLLAAGYRCGTPSERLQCRDPGNNTEFLYLRARDIPPLVAEGLIDAAITGRDFVAESERDLVELLALGFGRASVHYAVPAGEDSDLHVLHGRRVATALPALTRRDLAGRGIDARVVSMTGAVENAVHVGIADAIADVVDSGRTLAAHGLKIIGPPLIRSEAVLIARPDRASRSATVELTRQLAALVYTTAA